MVPRREGKREEKPEGAGHRRRKAAVMPHREEKREEKTEEAGHRRRKAAVMPRQEGKREEKTEERGTGGEKQLWCPIRRRRMKNFRCSKKQGAVWHPALFLFTVQILLTVLQKWYLHSAFSYHRSPLIQRHRFSDRYREADRPRFSGLSHTLF